MMIYKLLVAFALLATAYCQNLTETVPSLDDDYYQSIPCKNDSGTLYTKAYRCSGFHICADGSDDRDCDKCDEDFAFQCKKDRQCIGRYLVCDGVKNCDSGEDEDEKTCKDHKCPEGKRKCNGPRSTCLYESWFCDGMEDCPGGEDEQGCPATTPFPADLNSNNGTEPFEGWNNNGTEIFEGGNNGTDVGTMA